MTTTYLEAARIIAGDDLANELRDDVVECEKELAVRLNSQVKTVEEIGRHVADAGGKRLRPLLVSLGARITGNPFDRNRIHKLGACVEMIHMATLIHDDVIDEAPTRRGKPTANEIWGNTSAILSGDVLLSKAMEILAEDGDLEIIRSVSRAVVEMAEGEVRELGTRGQFELETEQHFEILMAKTARFMGACCRVGAMVAGGNTDQRAALTSFGESAGMAFQIADDMLDYRGDHSKTGKVRATDFREGCSTLPLILLRKQLSNPETEIVRNLFGNGVTETHLDDIVNWMTERNVFQQTEETTMSFVNQAVESLNCFDDSPAKSLLQSVAKYVASRES